MARGGGGLEKAAQKGGEAAGKAAATATGVGAVAAPIIGKAVGWLSKMVVRYGPLVAVAIFMGVGLAMMAWAQSEEQNSCSSGGAGGPSVYQPQEEGGPNILAAKDAMAEADAQQASEFVRLALFETGWVESKWRNLASRAMPESLSLPNDPPPAAGDHDSVGILQQRTSQGWGSIPEIMNPRYAAKQFIERAKVAEGNNYPTAGKLAQAVQRSAFPDRYDQEETKAKELMARVRAETGAGPSAGGAGGLQGAPLPGTDLSAPQVAPAGPAGVADNSATPLPNSVAATPALTGCGAGGGATSPYQVGSQIRVNKYGPQIPRQGPLGPDQFDIDIPTGPSGTVIAEALGQLGVDYSWGGGGPEGKSEGFGRGAGIIGFDCSGLTEFAWSKAGVKIGGFTGEQRNTLQAHGVTSQQAVPGDLIFYPGHVAIYAGLSNGQQVMIEAPQTGDKVKVSNVRPNGEWFSPLQLAPGATPAPGPGPDR